MKSSIKETAFKLGKKLFTHAAFSTHDSACIFGLYQPKEPECIKQK
jgi:cyclic lactone autoinducer peptide